MTAVQVANPILPGCHPDPSICRVGEWCYLAVSTFELLPAIPILRSRDLVSWETVGHVVDRDGVLDLEGVPSSGGVFAPTIRHDGSRFWVVSTLVDPERPDRGGTFVATATDAAGPWSDPVWLDVEGIDPSLLFDDDGRAWLHGTRLASDPEWHHQTEVWVRELDPERCELVGDEHVVWVGAVRGAVWAEGPHLLRAPDGGCLLLAAEGGTAFEHAVCVARADGPTGPFRGAPVNPVLTHRHLGRGAPVQAVGHADLVELEDGSWWAVLLATRPDDAGRHPLGRETFLCPVEWQDGWPVFAAVEGRVPGAIALDLAEPPPPGAWQPDARTAGAVRPEDPRWTSVRATRARFAEPSGEGWVLRATGAGLEDRGTPAFLGVRQQHHEVEVVARLEPLDPAARAALVLRQSEDDHVALVIEGDGGARRARLLHRERGATRELGSVPVPGSGPLALSVRAEGGGYALAVDGAPVGDVPCGALDTATRGGFLGVWVGVASLGPSGTVTACSSFRYAPLG